jgi:hypothetical protein
LQLAGSSFLAFALIYLASMFFRDRGARFARKFWEERDGLPSTRFGPDERFVSKSRSKEQNPAHGFEQVWNKAHVFRRGM